MIKKIVLLSLMLIASLGCIAQDYFYAVPNFNTKIGFGEDYSSYGITIDLQYYRNFIKNEKWWSRLSFGIGARIVNNEFKPTVGLSYGIGIDFNNFYGVIDLRPTVKSVGNNCQVYSDEFVFGIIPKIGFGYNWSVSNHIILFTEGGFYKEFYLFYTWDNFNVNSFGIYLNIGFRFKNI